MVRFRRLFSRFQSSLPFVSFLTFVVNDFQGICDAQVMDANEALQTQLAIRGKVAVVHDWLTGRRGAEKVLEEVLALLPGADVYTLVWRRGA